MTDVVVIEWIQSKYKNLMGDLDERARRRWSAVEALSLGRGGIVAVAKATGISDRTIRNGIRELREGDAPPEGRQRRIGGGRKSAKERDPKLLDALETLVEPTTRGDPMSPLKWTCKSTRELSAQLKKCGHIVSHTTVAELLKDAGFSLQANRKTIEGKQHPDRDAQFRHISSRIRSQHRAGQPALSVDTKKKEIIGTYKNPGRKWRRKGRPIEVQTHDFPERMTRVTPSRQFPTVSTISPEMKPGLTWASRMTRQNSRWLRYAHGGAGSDDDDTHKQSSAEFS